MAESQQHFPVRPLPSAAAPAGESREAQHAQQADKQQTLFAADLHVTQGAVAQFDAALPTGLEAALRSAMRPTQLAGPVPDPVANEVLASPSFKELDAKLAERGIHDLRTLPNGGGTSSIVLDAGDKVVRLGSGELTPRPNVEQVLQATEAGQAGSLRFEILPKVDTSDITPNDVERLEKSLAMYGYQWTDKGVDQVGLHKGRHVVLDPGGITPMRTADLATSIKEIQRLGHLQGLSVAVADATVKEPRGGVVVAVTDRHALLKVGERDAIAYEAARLDAPIGVGDKVAMQLITELSAAPTREAEKALLATPNKVPAAELTPGGR